MSGTKAVLQLDTKSPEHGKPFKLVFDRNVTVFGPCSESDPRPSAAQLTSCPRKLRIGRKTLNACRARMKNGALDFGTVFKKRGLKTTGYAFIPFRAVRSGRYEIGLGADWWFEAWLDGQPLLNTLGCGNSVHPPAREDWTASVDLDAGMHMLVVRVLSGNAGMTVDLGESRYSPARAYRVRTGCAPEMNRPIKVVFIGAGSMFLQRLFTDILTIPGADRGEVALVDINRERLSLAGLICKRIIDNAGKKWKVTTHTSRRRALKGAEYVTFCIEAAGNHRAEYEIPLKYGIDQAVGDTMGPGGLFKGMRNAPVLLGLLRDMEEICPEAYLLNYTNPMSILCLNVNRASSIKATGFCHSVQNTSGLLARWTGVPYHELKWTCSGINHMAWFTELSHRGKDLYPDLKKRVLANDPIVKQERVRLDLMMNFGYFCTESSGHNSEYVPYYRKRPDTLREYCGQDLGGRKKEFAKRYAAGRHRARSRSWLKQLAGKADLPARRGNEYASHVIEAMETNTPFVIHGSVMNRGLIANLPQDGVVEVPCMVDRSGIQPVSCGALPPQCAALCSAAMRYVDLASTACLEKSMEAARYAMLLDPLTSAVCSTAEIQKMTDELFKANREYLKGYK